MITAAAHCPIHESIHCHAEKQNEKRPLCVCFYRFFSKLIPAGEVLVLFFFLFTSCVHIPVTVGSHKRLWHKKQRTGSYDKQKNISCSRLPESVGPSRIAIWYENLEGQTLNVPVPVHNFTNCTYVYVSSTEVRREITRER